LNRKNLSFLIVEGIGSWTQTQVHLMQVDSGMTSLVWGIDQSEKSFIFSEENTLRPVIPSIITSIRHVTAGAAGVWAIDDSGRIYFRLGTSAYNRRGEFSHYANREKRSKDIFWKS